MSRKIVVNPYNKTMTVLPTSAEERFGFLDSVATDVAAQPAVDPKYAQRTSQRTVSRRSDFPGEA